MAERETLARPYAEAVFALARAARTLDTWLETLRLLALIQGHADMAALIGNPRVSRARVAQLFIDVGGARLDAHARNLARLLADNGRLALLPEIAHLFEQLKAEHERVVEAHAISAVPLDAAQREAVAAALARRFGREVRLTTEVDSHIGGGLIVRAGDTVIDGSVRARLAALAAALAR